jgi:hypothetical protein
VRRNPERHHQAHELEQQEGGDRLNPASAQVINTSRRGRALSLDPPVLSGESSGAEI